MTVAFLDPQRGDSSHPIEANQGEVSSAPAVAEKSGTDSQIVAVTGRDHFEGDGIAQFDRLDAPGAGFRDDRTGGSFEPQRVTRAHRPEREAARLRQAALEGFRSFENQVQVLRLEDDQMMSHCPSRLSSSGKRSPRATAPAALIVRQSGHRWDRSESLLSEEKSWPFDITSRSW